MTEPPRPRADVVELLADLIIDVAAEPSTWRHLDGRPVTPAEIVRLSTVTRKELEAAAAYSDALAARHRNHLAVIARAEELAAPILQRLPAGATPDDVLAAMDPGSERDEFARLIERIRAVDEVDATEGGEDR